MTASCRTTTALIARFSVWNSSVSPVTVV